MKQWLTTGIKSISKDHWADVENVCYVKPKGGLWASTYTPNGKYKSEWHEFCNKLSKEWVKDYGVVFDLKENARIYTVDGNDDLDVLHQKYKFEMNELMCIKFLDFEKISLDYDCIHLTSKGQRETRNNFPLDLYTWDVESLLILNFDCIGDNEYIEFYKEERKRCQKKKLV